MCKKVSIFLAVALVVALFSLSVVQAETVTIGSGDAVYRDMDIIWMPALWLVGHTGIYIGGNQVIHMQSSGCVKADFSKSFNNGYWGSFYAGGSYVADQRVKEANRLFNTVHPKFDFYDYKSFGDATKPRGRCDGMVEWCFEKCGDQVAFDFGWAMLTPQIQWKSSRITRRYTTARGKVTYNATSVSLVPGFFE